MQYTLIDVNSGALVTGPERKSRTAGFPRGFDNTYDPSHRDLAWAEHEPAPVLDPNQVASENDVADFVEDQWIIGWTVRDKTQEEIDAPLIALRAGMVVERWQFATACMLAGIITADEAKDWGPGNALPSSVDAALQAAIADTTTYNAAVVKALAVASIRRNNPLIEIMRGAFSLTLEQADDLFTTAAAMD